MRTLLPSETTLQFGKLVNPSTVAFLAEFQAVERLIGYTFDDKRGLYESASHYGLRRHQIYEQVGDVVLRAALTYLVIEKLDDDSIHIDRISQLVDQLATNAELGRVAAAAGLSTLIKPQQDSCWKAADFVEAIIGAVAIEGDLYDAFLVVLQLYGEKLSKENILRALHREHYTEDQFARAWSMEQRHLQMCYDPDLRSQRDRIEAVTRRFSSKSESEATETGMDRPRSRLFDYLVSASCKEAALGPYSRAYLAKIGQTAVRAMYFVVHWEQLLDREGKDEITKFRLAAEHGIEEAFRRSSGRSIYDTSFSTPKAGSKGDIHKACLGACVVNGELSPLHLWVLSAGAISTVITRYLSGEAAPQPKSRLFRDFPDLRQSRVADKMDPFSIELSGQPDREELERVARYLFPLLNASQGSPVTVQRHRLPVLPARNDLKDRTGKSWTPEIASTGNASFSLKGCSHTINVVRPPLMPIIVFCEDDLFALAHQNSASRSENVRVESPTHALHSNDQGVIIARFPRNDLPREDWQAAIIHAVAHELGGEEPRALRWKFDYLEQVTGEASPIKTFHGLAVWMKDHGYNLNEIEAAAEYELLERADSLKHPGERRLVFQDILAGMNAVLTSEAFTAFYDRLSSLYDEEEVASVLGDVGLKPPSPHAG